MKSALIIILLVLSSCSFHTLDYKGGQRIQFDKLEGKKISFIAGAKISNKNSFAIKVKPSIFSLFIEGEYIGLIHLNDKVRFKRKSEEYVDGSFTVFLGDGVMFRMLKFFNKKKLEIALIGDLEAEILIFGKKIKVNEEFTISGLDLNLR